MLLRFSEWARWSLLILILILIFFFFFLGHRTFKD